VAVAALDSLAREGAVEPAVVQQAIEKYEIDTESEAPWRR
jgi:pyruvate dehydrogenase complex dehydrogenase (E1) component